MFKRKVLIIALLAVVLLASFMDGRVSVDGKHRRRPRATIAGGISAVDLTLHQANLANLMEQISGGMPGVDPTNHLASRNNGIEVAGGIAAIDPNN